MGHVIKAQREKKIHLLKEANQMSDAASKSRKRGYEEWLLNQVLEASLNTLVSTVMRKRGRNHLAVMAEPVEHAERKLL